MRYDLSYEIVDGRVVAQNDKLFPCGIATPTPGGIILQMLDGRAINIPLGEEDLDDIDETFVMVKTDQGVITLVELTRGNFESNVRPFIEDPVPDFGSDLELNQYMYRLVRED